MRKTGVLLTASYLCLCEWVISTLNFNSPKVTRMPVADFAGGSAEYNSYFTTEVLLL